MMSDFKSTIVGKIGFIGPVKSARVRNMPN